MITIPTRITALPNKFFSKLGADHFGIYCTPDNGELPAFTYTSCLICASMVSVPMWSKKMNVWRSREVLAVYHEDPEMNSSVVVGEITAYWQWQSHGHPYRWKWYPFYYEWVVSLHPCWLTLKSWRWKWFLHYLVKAHYCITGDCTDH